MPGVPEVRRLAVPLPWAAAGQTCHLKEGNNTKGRDASKAVVRDDPYTNRQHAVVRVEDGKAHPNRNVITRAIGLDQQPQIDTYVIPLADGDLLLLCSDGLNSMILDEDIHRILTSSAPEEVCLALIDSANNQGGNDNTTVVIALLGDTLSTSPSTQDTLDIRPRPSLLDRVWRFVFRRK